MKSVIVQGFEYASEQPPIGYVTSTNIDGNYLLYGTFDTVEQAIGFGSKLINATVIPIYRPVLH